MRYVPPLRPLNILLESIEPSRASSTLTVVHVCVCVSRPPPPLSATNDLFTPLLAEKYLVLTLLTQLRHSRAFTHSRTRCFCTLRVRLYAGIKLEQKRGGDCGGGIDCVFDHLCRIGYFRPVFPTVRYWRRRHGHCHHRLLSGRVQTGEVRWRSESDRAACRHPHPASCCIASLQHFGSALVGDRRRSARSGHPPAPNDHLQSPDAYHDELVHTAAPPLYQ